MNQDNTKQATAEGHSGADKAATHGRTDSPAQAVIAHFGGIRPMAHKLGIAVSTVQGWKNRGAIPAQRHDAILQAAREHGIELDRAVLRASGEEARATETAGAAPPEGGATVSEPSSAAPATGIEATTAGGAGGREAPPAAPAPAAAPQPRPAGWIPGMLLGAAILAAGAAAAVVTRDQWRPYLGEAGPAVVQADDARIERLETRLEGLAGLQPAVEDLSAQVAALEDRVSTVEGGDGAALAKELDALRGRMDTLGQRVGEATDGLAALSERLTQAAGRMESAVGRIDQLATRVENVGGRVDELARTTATAEAVESLAQRVGTLETEVADLAGLKAQVADTANLEATARAAASRQVARALAVVELRDALRFSAPFAAELAAARKALPEETGAGDALDALAGFADRGVATREELRRRFEPAAAQAVAAAAGESEQGWVGGVLRRLNDVVTVRPVGENVEGQSVGAVLARAETRLDAGDLGAAVAAVRGLAGAPAQAMQPWLAQAEARVQAEQALTALSARLTDALTDTGGGA